ncbi:M15 family metallopeptidase [Paenibacillus mendelii]|uniref:D-alanyl-D-alanine carboxypeptidase family protein n=1 Tax=Paenibacillus mendelii TaxID=206163 RepID=A0ABV6JAE0_9BACL|nr:M15 family metallopeptidase [Paenibacillus mendelii]MCQ6559782.1 M15 family metallopeptidase [Paenibacillus mendelii]
MYNTKWTCIAGIAALSISLTACAGPSKEQGHTVGAQAAHVQTNHKPQDGPSTVPTSEEQGQQEDRSIQVFVNKQNSLAKDFAPEDLVDVDVPTVLQNPEVNQMRKEAAEALKLMFSKAEESGYKLYARSGYRSYKTQEALFDGYAARSGQSAASRFSARAGQSEHQTGLAMDITSESVSLQLSEDFGETAEGKWVSENAHRYGFIIRYPKNKEDITGYMYEPWHIRYLGVDTATKVYESGLTLEEYRNEVSPS